MTQVFEASYQFLKRMVHPGTACKGKQAINSMLMRYWDSHKCLGTGKLTLKLPPRDKHVRHNDSLVQVQDGSLWMLTEDNMDGSFIGVNIETRPFCTSHLKASVSRVGLPARTISGGEIFCWKAVGIFRMHGIQPDVTRVIREEDVTAKLVQMHVGGVHIISTFPRAWLMMS